MLDALKKDFDITFERAVQPRDDARRQFREERSKSRREHVQWARRAPPVSWLIRRNHMCLLGEFDRINT